MRNLVFISYFIAQDKSGQMQDVYSTKPIFLICFPSFDPFCSMSVISKRKSGQAEALTCKAHAPRHPPFYTVRSESCPHSAKRGRRAAALPAALQVASRGSRFCTSYKVFQNNQLAGNSQRQQKKYPGHKTWWDVHGQTPKMAFGQKKVSVDEFLCTSISSEVGSGVLQYHRNRFPHSVAIVEVLDQPSLTSCSCAPSMTKLLPNKASRIFSRGSWKLTASDLHLLPTNASWLRL